MPRVTFSLITLFCLLAGQISAVNPVHPEVSITEKKAVLTPQEFVQLNAKEFAELTNQKFGLKERMVFNFTKRQVRRQLAKGEMQLQATEMYFNNSARFNLGGFLLGFFLGLIGVLIAILFGRNAVRSALIGFLCLIIVGLIVWLL